MSLMVLSIGSSVLILIMHNAKRPLPKWMKKRTGTYDIESKTPDDNPGKANASPNFDLSDLLSYMKKKEKEEEEREAWVAIASKLDRLFLLVFSAATFIITLALFGFYPLSRSDIEPQTVS